MVFLISDAAKKVKVEAHVLRYWEEELGLPIKRNELGHRYYTEEDVKRFQEIKDLKERGLQLKAIRMVLKNGKLDMLPPQKEDIAAKNSHTEKQDVDDWQEAIEKETLKAEDLKRSEEIIRAESVLKEETYEVADTQENTLYSETNEDKFKRLQWLLKQLFRETLQENNEYLCREMKESLLKELDYQFRMQEERDEEREAQSVKRDEEHFKRIDELLRKKRRLLKK